ncbi:MAG: AraC family transcriptional regulator [Salinivirgaceae bacterium]|nr:AraC family transcriptional regulator [Salinivirgaceae bacterium]
MREDYIERINKILIYIDDNLDNSLSLETISKIAFYSPFHLHRLFKAITNETLNGYVTRKRIEKAALLLLHHKEISIAELSMQYGFNSNSSFTRTFKKYYGVSPIQFRSSNSNNFSKIGKAESKNGQETRDIEKYICNIMNLKNWMTMNAKIEIKEMPKLDVAFITQIGENGLDKAFEKLVKWARPKGLLESKDFRMARVYHDSFKITEPEKVRMSVCILLKEPLEVSGEIGLTTIEKGKFIVGHFEIEPEDFEKSWSGLYIWMNENGFQKAERNPFEIFHNNYHEHPEKKSIVDLYIPIK